MISHIRASLAKRRAALEEGDAGFTLIELLVVVLIIGILAAIAIPIFLGQQTSAKDSAAQSDAANAGLAEAAYYTANSSLYTGTYSDLTTYGATTSSATPVPTVNTARTAFCVSVASAAGSTRTFAVSNTTTVAKGTCAAGVFTAATSNWGN